MAATHDIGKFFWFFGRFETVDLPRIPLIGRLPSQEIDPPFRQSLAVMFRVPFTKVGIVFGVWRISEITEEEDALLQATYGSGYTVFEQDNFKVAVNPEVDLRDAQVRAAVRKSIAETNMDPDDEWQVLNILGVVE